MTTPAIASIHRTYCSLTGWMISISPWRERMWFEFLKRGFTDADLVKVVMHLRAEIRKGNRNPGALKYHNLIEDTDRFEEELAMAGMRDRQFREKSKVSDGKRSVLAATGRDAGDGAVSAAVPVSVLIENLKRSAGMIP